MQKDGCSDREEERPESWQRRSTSPRAKEKPSDLGWLVCVSGFAEVRGRRGSILKNKLQCIPECQVVTGGILWFYVSHRRVKD